MKKPPESERNTAQYRTYYKGDVVIRQGNRGEYLFTLQSGKLGVFFNPGVNCPADEKIHTEGVQLAVLDEPKTILGEVGLIGGKAGASVTCMSDKAEMALLPVSGDWKEELHRYPEIALKLCRTLAQRVQVTVMRLRNSRAFSHTVDKALKHFATELIGIVERGDSTLKRRAYVEIDDDLRSLLEGLQTLRRTDFYAAGLDVSGMGVRSRTTRMVRRRHRRDACSVQLEEGEVLFREGDTDGYLYLLLEGELSLQTSGKPLVAIAPDEFFCDISFLFEPIPECVTTVQATVLSKVIRVCKGLREFEETATERPWLAVTIAGYLAHCLQTYNDILATNFFSMKDTVSQMGTNQKTGDDLFTGLAKLLGRHDALRDLAEQAVVCASRLTDMRANLLRELEDKASPMAVEK